METKLILQMAGAALGLLIAYKLSTVVIAILKGVLEALANLLVTVLEVVVRIVRGTFNLFVKTKLDPVKIRAAQTFQPNE